MRVGASFYTFIIHFYQILYHFSQFAETLMLITDINPTDCDVIFMIMTDVILKVSVLLIFSPDNVF